MPWQPSTIVYPDVELVVTVLLRNLLTGRSEPYVQGIYVGNSVPNPRRDRMLVVRRDGGPVESLRDVTLVNVRAWAPREADAVALFNLAAALLRGCADGSPILRVTQQSGPIAVAEQTGPLRFGLFEIATRGEQIT